MISYFTNKIAIHIITDRELLAIIFGGVALVIIICLLSAFFYLKRKNKSKLARDPNKPVRPKLNSKQEQESEH